MRNQHIDALTGFVVLFMIYAHICQWTNCLGYFFTIPHHIVMFMMPFFFFKSGMYFRRKEIGETLKSSAKRLLIPFCIFTILAIPVYLYDDGISINTLILTPIKDIIEEGAFHRNSALWFLVTLFLIRNIANIVFAKNQRITFASVLTSLIVSYFLTGKHIPFYIGNTCLGFFFFGCGYLYHMINDKKTYNYIALCIYIIVELFLYARLDVHANFVIKGNYFIGAIGAISGIIAFIKSFEKLPKIPTFLCNCGKDSMTLYVTHILILDISNRFFVQIFGLASYPLFFANFTIVFIVTYFMLRPLFNLPKLKWMVGL